MEVGLPTILRENRASCHFILNNEAVGCFIRKNGSEVSGFSKIIVSPLHGFILHFFWRGSPKIAKGSTRRGGSRDAKESTQGLLWGPGDRWHLETLPGLMLRILRPQGEALKAPGRLW